MRIGLIADTHNLLRPEARQALAGVARILHAGDVCGRQVLDELGAIAPVTAVRGNNDRGAWAGTLPEETVVDVEQTRILVVHDLATLDRDAAAERIDVVVSGHSHRPSIVQRGPVLYVNPGSAGPRRFRLPVSIGILEIRDGGIDARLVELHPA